MSILILMLLLAQAITLRGTVWEGADTPAADALVTIAGDSKTLQTRSAQDGTFTFKLSKPGNYQLNAQRGNLIGHASTLFVGKDMDGVGIVLRAEVNPIVLGSVRMEGDQPLPSPLPKIVIRYPSGNIAGRFNVDARGLFFFAVTPVEFNIALEDLDESYAVKSISSGDTDLTKNTMKLMPGAAIRPLVIILKPRF
jgi:hypothetical protein